MNIVNIKHICHASLKVQDILIIQFSLVALLRFMSC